MFASKAVICLEIKKKLIIHNVAFLLKNLYASSKKSKAQQLLRISKFRKEGKLKKIPYEITQ